MGKAKGDLNPFTKRDFDEIVKAERRLADMLPVLDAAEACGIECQTFREVTAAFLDRFSKLRTNFMNPPPSR